MKFSDFKKYSFKYKFILITIFIPCIVIIMFFVVPIIMTIACVLTVLMYITGKKYDLLSRIMQLIDNFKNRSR